MPSLYRWIADRDAVVSEVGLDREIVKAAVNAIITCPYTCSFGMDDISADDKETLHGSSYIIQLVGELKLVHTVFLNRYKSFCRLIQEDPQCKKKSTASKLSRLYQDVESVAMAAARACLSPEAPMGIKHDQIDVLLGSGENPEAVRVAMEQAMLEATGIPFQMKMKLVTTTLPLQIDRGVMSDYEAWRLKFEEEYMYVLCEPMGLIKVDRRSGIMTPIKMADLKAVRGDEVAFLDRWSKDPERRRYDYVGMYPPPMDVPDKTLNIWDYKQFAAESLDPIQPEEDVDALLSPFHDLVSHVTGGEEACVDGLLNFMAHMIQYPGVKVVGSVMSRGNQGCGRNTLIEHLFGKRILGDKLFVLIGSFRELFRKFSFPAESALFIFVHESDRKDFTDGYNDLKKYTGGATWPVEHKFHRPISVNALARVYINSNDLGATAIPIDDRRIVLQLGSVKPVGADFFPKIYANLVENDRAVRAVYEYLLHRDLGSYDPNKVIHDTAAAKTARTFQFMRTEGTKFPVFLRSFLPVAERLFRESDNKLDGKKLSIPTAFLYDCFEEWLSAKVPATVSANLKPADELNRFKDASAMIVNRSRVEIITKDANPNTRNHALGSAFRATHFLLEHVNNKINDIIGSEDVDDLLEGMENVYHEKFELWMSKRR